MESNVSLAFLTATGAALAMGCGRSERIFYAACKSPSVFSCAFFQGFAPETIRDDRKRVVGIFPAFWSPRSFR